eukprot:TRINITY_DN55689_c0_g1_i1.p2 TRINITY_DN55689_c0_g1~~TRINITY_DN55689_c0_g1_i1.p2  ORF type:complete len:247 (+),score=65.57 TRINITY_DN55689_c0_g1_i1:92-832(+)
MPTPNSWVFHPQAYGKAYLHAFKHPSQAISGLFVGKVVDGPAGCTVYVHDAFPLFHTHLHLRPLFDVALAQVAELAKAGYGGQSDGWHIIGYYAAESRVDDDTPTAFTEKVGKSLAAAADGAKPQPCAFVAQIVNRRITASPQEFAMKIYNVNPSVTQMSQAAAGADGVTDGEHLRFGYLDSGNVPRDVVDGAHAVMERLGLALREGGLLDKLADFEAHLERIELDITNAEVAAGLAGNIVPVLDP